MSRPDPQRRLHLRTSPFDRESRPAHSRTVPPHHRDSLQEPQGDGRGGQWSSLELAGRRAQRVPPAGPASLSPHERDAPAGFPHAAARSGTASQRAAPLGAAYPSARTRTAYAWRNVYEPHHVRPIDIVCRALTLWAGTACPPFPSTGSTPTIPATSSSGTSATRATASSRSFNLRRRRSPTQDGIVRSTGCRISSSTSSSTATSNTTRPSFQ